MITPKLYRRLLIGFSFIICHLAFSMMFISCAEKANEWPVDPSYDRLYTTTHFELDDTKATSVVLKFNGITNATKYVFEFSLGDSLKFNNIVRTDEVKADTLTAYSEGKVMVQNEYKKLFEDLNGTTRYSVRVKGVDERTGSESVWSGLSFLTPAEQIFTGATPGIKDAMLYWEAGKEVTTIKIGTKADKDTTWVSTVNITDAQKQLGEAAIADLTPGTKYIAQIMNGEFLRGSYNFTTLGSSVGQTIEVQPGDDVLALLTEATDETVTLIFTGGQEYEFGSQLRVPENIVNLYFSGKMVGDQRPVLKMSKGFRLTGNKGDIKFQYVEMDDAEGEAYWFNPDKNNVDNFVFEGCFIRNIPRTLLYINNDDVVFKHILIDNCVIYNVGVAGYGMLNIGKNTVTMESITITNTTMMEIGDQLMDLRCQIDLFKVDKCTFCNYTTKLQKWIRADNKRAPKEAQVTNMIFCGPNGGQKMNSGYNDYSGWLEFSGSYLTSDFPENTTTFLNATHLELSTEELFVDPQHGDFHVRPEANFRGRGKAGDPRWWK